MLESSVGRMKDEIQRTSEMARSSKKTLQNLELNISHLKQEIKDEVTDLIGSPKQWHQEVLEVIDTRKELESIEEGFYLKVREISELRNRISQLENLVQTHKDRLSQIDDFFAQR
jgi:chromosome segregation ATPase